MTSPVHDVAPALRKAAQLRTLCLRLPHAPTPAERARLERFAEIAAAPHLTGAADVEAIATGWRAWWREQRLDLLRAVVRRTPAALIATDHRLAALALVVTSGD